jgi:predicted outer membrane repeat protein
LTGSSALFLFFFSFCSDVSWGFSSDFNGVPLLGTYVVIDYALTKADSTCPEINDIAECTGVNCLGWKRHSMNQPLPCLPPAADITIGGAFSVGTQDVDQLLVPGTDYCVRICCAATPFDGSSMSTREDFQHHTWSNDGVSSCPSNKWTVAKKRTAPPPCPLAIPNDDISIVEQDEESLTVKWEPQTEDTTITAYLVLVAKEADNMCGVQYNLSNNITVNINTNQIQIRNLASQTSYYIGVVAQNIGGIVAMQDIGRKLGRTTLKNTDMFVCHPSDLVCQKGASKSGSFSTLGAALRNTTEPGQKITVHEGIFSLLRGPLTFQTHQIILQGQQGKTTTTIVDCMGHRCFESRNKCQKGNDLHNKWIEFNNGRSGKPTDDWDGGFFGSWPFAKTIAYITLKNGTAPMMESGGLVQMAMPWNIVDTWEKITYTTEFVLVHFEGGRATHGGCLSVDNRHVKLRQCSFTFCQAGAGGGAVVLTGKSKLVVNGSTFSNNTAGLKTNTKIGIPLSIACQQLRKKTPFIGGGAIASFSKLDHIKCPPLNPNIFNPSVIIKETTFAFHTAECGEGGTLHHQQTSVEIVDSSIKYSKCNYAGGALFISKSTANLKGSMFQHNEALQANGGVATVLGTGTRIDQCIFSDNTASGSGGGLYFVFSDVVMEASTFQKNFAGSDGGGVALESSCNFYSENNMFQDNTASTNGGGISARGTKKFISTKDTLKNNQGKNGGCIHIAAPLQNVSIYSFVKKQINMTLTYSSSITTCIFLWFYVLSISTTTRR